MVLGARAEWFSVFEVWFAARFRAEFPDADWIFLVNDPAARVTATPRGNDRVKISVSMPPDFQTTEPYVVAAQVAAQVRIKAEEMGLVQRRRSGPTKLGSSGGFQLA